jgi:hypothetical protein
MTDIFAIAIEAIVANRLAARGPFIGTAKSFSHVVLETAYRMTDELVLSPVTDFSDLGKCPSFWP